MSKESAVGQQKIAVFDLDGTITYKDTYVAFLLLCLKKRPLRVLRGGELVFYLLVHKAGLRTNHWLKAKYLGTVAGGLGGTQLDDIVEEFCVATIEKNIKPLALAEMDKLRSQGYTLVLATASFGFYVERLFRSLNMDYLLCSKAMLDTDGKITGDLDGKNCIGDEKASRLKALMMDQKWNSIARAYSDDLVDLPLFKMADMPLVVDPAGTSAVKAKALEFTVLNWL